ncbi:S8 family peptidase [Agromyces sp. LHK192]|uniref:S8 family peptidase n=1 Tax=Agromyces sp. LHK192 TaxID=2498704 RepID=UPI00196ACB42|nr:S8 family peptidase [Agromyces sp. LHK192]
MGMIDGKEPPPAATPTIEPRVIVKVRDDARAEFTRRRAQAEGRGDAGRKPEASDPGVELLDAVAFVGDLLAARQDAIAAEAHLDSLASERFAGSSGRRARFASYAAISVADEASARELAADLDARPDIETAYVEGGPTPPPVDATDDPMSSDQGYLDAAPDGVDARWAWDRADGSGIGFVGLEQGWTRNHEDLAAAGITIISGVSEAYHGHGTAVLGEVVGVDNARGVVGIAPGASARVVSQFRTSTTYSTAEAIISAADAMSPGDVLLLEAQTTVAGSNYLPVEVEQAVFDAIRDATDAGIIVVEAAGNGSTDLDAFTTSAGKRVLDRGHADFRDSGAIMVGAAGSNAPHGRLSFSNFGSRIDCYGWGNNITTTGDGWTGTSTTEYTTSFGGTSGASPIVTGAALLLQSWHKQRKGWAMGPSTLRSWLSSSINTPSANPPTDRIGVMPNLRAIIEGIIEDERFDIDVDKYQLWVYILFGILNDAPGVIWVPGKGPVPVDPEWFKLGQEQRRLLVTELATEVRGLEQRGGRLTVREVDRIGQAAFAEVVAKVAGRVNG